jgi:hypothetical protein
MVQSVAKEPKTGYQLDPAAVGVTLGAPGMPTRGTTTFLFTRLNS